MTTDIKDLFPTPHRFALYSRQTPSPFPGATHDSATQLAELLKINHEKFHVFFNDRGFHNHLSHHLFVSYAFGAPPSLIREAYDSHAVYQRPAYSSPETIDHANWKKHLGDENFYNAYLLFFANEITTGEGLSKTLEKFVFSSDANWGVNVDAQPPRMFSRFLGGLLHPLIHFGHIEFGMLGMAVEGLAQAAVTKPSTECLFPRDFFPSDPVASTITSAANSLIRLVISPTKSNEVGTHPFTILARMLNDPRLAPGDACERDSDAHFTDTINSRGDVIRKYAEEWVIPLEPHQIEPKIEELAWVAALIFGLGGWREGKIFRADFFTLHILTSSLFIPSVTAHLSLSSQRTLLRGYFLTILGYWVSRGRPQLPIRSYFAETTATPTPPISAPHPDPSALGKSTPFANPWLALTQSALAYPEEHVAKAMRALAHYGAIYGTRPVGFFSLGNEKGLDGAEDVLDGTLFVRIAGELMDTMGWVREGKPKGGYDRAGLGWDELWE